MASSSCTSRTLFFIVLFASAQLLLVHSAFEFEVGEDKSWVVPTSSKNEQAYNDWASKQRFQVDDTVHFKYQKDSVLVVTESEYEKCRSAHPLFFSNNGDTVFKFDEPGLFYFISGVAGHCERGQKMIIKVLEPEKAAPPANQNETTDSSSASTVHSAIAVFPVAGIIYLFGVLFV
ncbi:hypothetical protein GIB67_024330 [Kingdonia uniflora]|uniref:Phytocyanin domain-containing protein n=1 Tax=Kingdonia uniflora TaxID=39325 RepID=A0A7J7LF00_9MAGN|nr:hypothetical protein GIB67_024330 [Kingdonia uniflora]